MKYHIVLTSPTARRIEREYAASKTLPRSDLSLLSEYLNASFIKPPSLIITQPDRILAKIYSTAENWAYARYLSSHLEADDVVFCPGEEIGIPLAKFCQAKKGRPKIIVWFHRIAGLRTRIVLKLWKISNAVDLSVVNTRPNQDILHNYLNIERDRIQFLWHPIDSNYYVPKLASANKTRPIIASIGLEQRDYRLLAAATDKLDIEVKVAGFSQFQSRIAKNFPKVMPENMTNKKYEFSELMQLYYDADVIVIPLKENSGAAGITVLLEAMSCKKPIVCVRTKGLTNFLDEQAVMTVKPGDVAGLRKAILYLLNNPEEAELKARRAYELIHEQHDLEKQVRILANFIRKIEQFKSNSLK